MGNVTRQPPRRLAAKSEPIAVRGFVRADIPRVLEIEARCHLGPDPVDPLDRKDLDRLAGRPCNLGIVAERRLPEDPAPGWLPFIPIPEPRFDVAGFMAVRPMQECFYLWRLAVDPACRRRGVASCLLEHLKRQLREGHRIAIFADVPERDLALQLCLRSRGFTCVRTWFDDRPQANPDDNEIYRFRITIDDLKGTSA